MREPVLDEPVIVLTAARSGSTLLRLILDAHPDLACPPETNIVKVCAQLSGIFSMLGAGQHLPEEARSGIQVMVRAVYRDYLVRCGKLRWCDKSIGTAPIAAWFAELYPKAKFICLYRHCMDVIDSGLEASPWGLMGYGFEQFSGMRNGNSVSALAAYWTEHTGRILEFEKKHGDRCIRVYYEELCQDPGRVADEIFSFIGVSRGPAITKRLPGDADTATIGPGDHKVWATRKITADSVGRGIRVPVSMIPGPQLKVVNHLLGELGYAPVDDSWRRSACPPALLPSRSAAGQRLDEVVPSSVGDTIGRSVLNNIGDVICGKIGAGLRLGLPRQASAGWGGSVFGLVAYHADGHGLARSWRVDLANRSITPLDTWAAEEETSGRFPADWLVTGDVGTWLGVLSERVNMASCIRSGVLRYIDLHDENGQEDGPTEAAIAEERLTVVRELLGLFGYPEESAPLAGALVAGVGQALRIAQFLIKIVSLISQSF